MNALGILSFNFVVLFHAKTPDVYEESESDLVTESNNNNRSTKSRSPDVHYVKVTRNDRKISSGYFPSDTATALSMPLTFSCNNKVSLFSFPRLYFDLCFAIDSIVSTHNAHHCTRTHHIIFSSTFLPYV